MAEERDGEGGGNYLGREMNSCLHTWHHGWVITLFWRRRGGRGEGGRDVGLVHYVFFLYSVCRCVSTSVLLNPLDYSSSAGVHLQKLIFPPIFLHSVYFAFLTLHPSPKNYFTFLTNDHGARTYRVKMNRGSVSALSTGAYTATLYVMVID
jgi:hypothetical protein